MMNRKQAIEWIKLLAAGHTAPEAQEAVEMACEALDKQLPKQRGKFGICPTCKKPLFYGYDYCRYCGQRISWKEEKREK